MTAVCEEQRVWLLPYGVLCGGLLSDHTWASRSLVPAR